MSFKTFKERVCAFINKHAIRGTKATWGLFIFYTLLLFSIVVTSHWFTFHGFVISRPWRQPVGFFSFWLPKITISLFLSFFILNCQKKWWTIVLLFFIDIWVISNIVYYRANNCLLTWDAILMANNLQGFTSSIGFYWNWQCNFFIFITLFYIACLPWFKLTPIGIYWKLIIGIFILINYFLGTHLFLSWLEKYTETKWKYSVNYIPFVLKNNDCNLHVYAQYHSIIANFPKIIIDGCSSASKIDYTQEELDKLSQFIGTKSTIPHYNLCIVLVESLESFALETIDIDKNYLLPNLSQLSTHPQTLFCSKITSQARHGVSSDGQMTITTGLLPLQLGAAVMIYGTNTYPSFVHLYPHSHLSNPVSGITWNQEVISQTYGYKTMQHGYKHIQDAEIFNRMNNDLPNYQDSLYCYFAITAASHTPFKSIVNSSLHFNSDMPQTMQDYLTCLHYTDSCFGVWYNKWKETEQAKNTVLVITGDHTIFKDAMLKEFKSYAQQAGLSIASGKTYCPLIIQAPQIEKNIQITDVCYQMDVYPTIMHLIGCEDYFWKGFGVNLLDSMARHNRPITEKEAYQLSDKIIRSDYFATHAPK